MLHRWHIAHPHCRQLPIPPNLSLSIAPIPPPTHSAFAGSTAWRAAGRQTGQEASKELPATSQVQQHSHSPSQASKNNGLSWPHQHVLLQVHFSSCPPPGQMERGAPTRAHSSGQGHAKYRTAEEPAGPRLGHGGGMQKEGIILSAIAL